jgi:hypothetical protein
MPSRRLSGRVRLIAARKNALEPSITNKVGVPVSPPSLRQALEQVLGCGRILTGSFLYPQPMLIALLPHRSDHTLVPEVSVMDVNNQ